MLDWVFLENGVECSGCETEGWFERGAGVRSDRADTAVRFDEEVEVRFDGFFFD